jgi:hypothetical protein
MTTVPNTDCLNARRLRLVVTGMAVRWTVACSWASQEQQRPCRITPRLSVADVILAGNCTAIAYRDRASVE